MIAAFFDSQTWIVVRNVGIFFVAVFWLSVGYWVYKDARRRIEDPWLVAMATLLGLAFRLHDPDHLLGPEFEGREDIGITCALVPTHTPGVNIGRRHFPLNAVFQNGPNWGRDVFMPLEWIIGGPKMAGQGWRMLVEQLSVGRCISLPSNATGASKAATYASGAYSRIRRQFNVSIGQFEGIQEVLAHMAGVRGSNNG